VPLPEGLRRALDQLTGQYTRAELTRATAELIAGYRDLASPPPALRREIDVAAYAVYRVPATYAAVDAVLGHLHGQRLDFAPSTLLDVGAGPGTASWAALEHFPSLVTMRLFERNPQMIAAGREIASWTGVSERVQWDQGDVTEGAIGCTAELVTASYVLGELSPGAIDSMAASLWAATTDTLVVVEPGTPAGFERVRRVRALTIEWGGWIASPCPAEMPCPMAGDWCHFSARLIRDERHRAVKGADLPYEDEKFSYLAVCRPEGAARADRILRHPQVRSGMIRLQLCTPEGARERVVTRRERTVFRDARHARWGDRWCEERPDDRLPEGENAE
jgi:ribosomal protein RSM22 (predicted rRNA methylase)